MLIYEFIVLVATLAILVKASDYFVDSSARLAKLLNISEFIIGFTLVAIGTSLPELVSSIAASLYKNSGLIIGNIAGSNIANIGLIVGIAALFRPLEIEKKIFSKEGIFLLFVTALFLILAFNHNISRGEGIIFLCIYLGYSIVLLETEVLQGRLKRFMRDMFRLGLVNSVKDHMNNYKENKKKKKKLEKKEKLSILYQIMIILLSGAAMYFSAKFLIPAAQNIAIGLNVPNSFIGVTMIAVGTSLPELIVAITAVRKGLGHMLVGTILGSNIANILLIIGISAVIGPIAVQGLALYYYMPIMLIMVLLLLAFIRTFWVVRMLEGFMLLALYIIFILILLFIV